MHKSQLHGPNSWPWVVSHCLVLLFPFVIISIVHELEGIKTFSRVRDVLVTPFSCLTMIIGLAHFVISSHDCDVKLKGCLLCISKLSKRSLQVRVRVWFEVSLIIVYELQHFLAIFCKVKGCRSCLTEYNYGF